MTPGAVKLRESLQQRWRIYFGLNLNGDQSFSSRNALPLFKPSVDSTLSNAA